MGGRANPDIHSTHPWALTTHPNRNTEQPGRLNRSSWAREPRHGAAIAARSQPHVRREALAGGRNGEKRSRWVAVLTLT